MHLMKILHNTLPISFHPLPECQQRSGIFIVFCPRAFLKRPGSLFFSLTHFFLL